jgi:hypothetical protein
MRRLSLLVPVLALSLLLGGRLAVADEPQPPAPEKESTIPGPPTAPPVCSDEVAEQALEVFKDDYAAKGLKGDDRLSQRDFAMSRLVKAQHYKVVDALAKVARGSDSTLRIIAVIYLGEMNALPAYAGEKIVEVMRRNSKDEILVMSALQSLSRLRDLSAGEDISAYLKDEDFALKKAAIDALGRMGDVRMMPPLLKLLGIEVKLGTPSGGDDGQSGGKEEVVEEGYSWDGVDVTYDTGAPDDSDQKMAEKIGKEQLAKNQAEAAAAAAAKNGGSGGGNAPAGTMSGRGGTSRNPSELIPYVLRALRHMTGEDFAGPRDIVKWLMENRHEIREHKKVMNDAEKEQREAGKRKE